MFFLAWAVRYFDVFVNSISFYRCSCLSSLLQLSMSPINPPRLVAHVMVAGNLKVACLIA